MQFALPTGKEALTWILSVTIQSQVTRDISLLMAASGYGSKNFVRRFGAIATDAKYASGIF